MPKQTGSKVKFVLSCSLLVLVILSVSFLFFDLGGMLGFSQNSSNSSPTTIRIPVSNLKILEMHEPKSKDTTAPMEKIVKTKEEWRELLSDQQFRVTREKGTEPAKTGKYWDSKEEGTYSCICCGLPLFSSDTKYESGTGWPSFWTPIKMENVTTKSDVSFFMSRVEVLCSRCDAHLGHVFGDGPQPTGLRYCMNSAALNLVKKEE